MVPEVEELTPEQYIAKLRRMAEVATQIAEDAEIDTLERDGQPLTAANVARWMGEDNAKIQALANSVAVLCLKMEELLSA